MTELRAVHLQPESAETDTRLADQVNADPAGGQPSPPASRLHQAAMVLVVGLPFLWCLQRAFGFATLSIASRFALYDDEGYVLMSVREFLAGGALYNDVFTQYGPAYYAYKHVLSFFQGVPTHDLTRLTTGYTWMAAASLLGLAGLWITRSGLAGLAAFCVASFALWPLGSEPGHPQEFLVALTSMAVAVAASPMALSRRVAVLAVICALACFTKVNVGAFVVLSTLLAVVPLPTAAIRLIVGLVAGLVPVVIMWPNLALWAAPYAAGAGAGIVTAVVLRPDSGWWPSLRRAAPVLAGLVVPVLALTIYLVARGTTLGALIDGILLRPARSNNLVVIALPVPVGAVVISLVSAACAIYLSQGSSALVRLQPVLAAVKIAVGLYVLLPGTWNRPDVIGASAGIVALLLLGARGPESFGRGFLGLSAALHTMTAYPVAGSQIAWSSCLLLVAASVCLWDGVVAFRSMVSPVPAFSRVVASGFAALAVALYFYTLTPVGALQALVRTHVALPFEGAGSIRTGHTETATFNWLVQNVKGHCTDVVTLPGFNSLYAWAGMRPPTGYNNGAWMILVSDDEQRSTVERLKSSARPCAVNNPGSPFMWTSQSLKGRPLVDYITALTPAATHAGYEIRVPAAAVGSWQHTYLQAGARAYTGSDISPVPAQSVSARSIRLWFRGTGRGGTLLGVQSTTTMQIPPAGWCPMIYLGRDGRLRAEMWNGAMSPITTPTPVDDRQWHHAVFVRKPDAQRLYVDGVLIGEAAPERPADWTAYMQLGTGYTALWPEGNGGWFPFDGELRDVVIASKAWEPEDVARDFVSSRQEGPGGPPAAR